MPSEKTDDFSYATSEDARLKRLLIRVVEQMTGQPYLKRLYEDHRANPIPGESFWAAALRRLEVSVKYNDAGLAHVPRDGALVIVANHPFGVLDGLIISWLISRIRKDFIVLTNAVLYQAEEIKQHLLPIDFAETMDQQNRETFTNHIIGNIDSAGTRDMIGHAQVTRAFGKALQAAHTAPDLLP